MSSSPIVVVAAKRTPIGSFQGQLSTFNAPELGGIVLKEVASNIPPAVDIDQVIMGCVLTAGLGQAPARQAVHYANLNSNIPAMTLNNVCGSGLKSVMMGYDMIKSGQAQCIIAGGMESMSNAPYLLPGSRQGYRFGHRAVQDHMMLDGLQNAYDQHAAMGVIAEQLAEKNNYSRAQQDSYTLQSIDYALLAQNDNAFAQEITPITISDKKGDVQISQDESITKLKPEKLSSLKPVFKSTGTITAGNASSINDGAAAVTLMTQSLAEAHGLKPLARIIAHSSIALDPQWFTLAPIHAIKEVCQRAGWALDEVDLFEINEAFAVVPMAAIDELRIDRTKVNIRGGACALGHPIGASGARILVTLIHALKAKNLKRGIASLCIGGGEGVAMAIECNY